MTEQQKTAEPTQIDAGELERAVLDQKNMEIRMLKQGFKAIEVSK